VTIAQKYDGSAVLLLSLLVPFFFYFSLPSDFTLFHHVSLLPFFFFPAAAFMPARDLLKHCDMEAPKTNSGVTKHASRVKIVL